MKRTEAINAAVRAAQAVPAIVSTSIIGLKAEFVVKGGRTIYAVPDYGYRDGWSRTDNEHRADRVLLKAGRIGIGLDAGETTRTYRVRKDGTLNEDGMTQALAELADVQIRDVAHREKHNDLEDRKKQLRTDTIRRLHDITGEFWDEVFEHYCNSAGVNAGGFDMDMCVKDNGTVKIVIDDMPMLAVERFLEMLNFEKDPTAV